MSNKHIFIFVVALLAAGGPAAQSNDNEMAQRKPGLTAADRQDGDWISYRDVYKLMIRFEKYGKPKQFIQNSYQVLPKDKKASVEDLHFTLTGKTIRLDLPADAAGRVTVPLLKTAYDENAELSLNRKISLYVFRPRVSIVARADGIYESADLLKACEQVLSYLQYSGDISAADKKCTGVKFSYARNAADSVARFRAGASLKPLPVAEGSAFADDAGNIFKTAVYRFSDWPEHGQVITQSVPVAIAALFD
ncbi:hypothetical protein ACO0LO_26305 [Undibacterium sp. TJN25]|uniref:hypothetical protein n=1 Tax=Undibacterium sp. TJN25 TaxID=3413056 RepID=UPI003BF0C126